MALWQQFQRPFDASPDSDIPKNVLSTLVINNRHAPRHVPQCPDVYATLSHYVEYVWELVSASEAIVRLLLES